MINNINQKKRVAVIGGGPSGIVSSKTALECGFDVVLFEKNDNIGGVWSIGESGKAWENMKTHISYVSMSFSDFGWDVPNERKPFHPYKEEMFKYLYDYSKHFKVLENTRLNTTVNNISMVDNNTSKQWLIKSNKTNTVENDKCEQVEEIFDFVIICTGMFSKKRDINIMDKLKNFKGKIWSSNEYKNSKPFVDKKVLVVGGSSSAIEISTAMANHTKMVYLNSKKSVYVLKRKFPLLNNDNLPIFDHCLQKRSINYNTEKISIEEINKSLNNFLNSASENQRENKLFPYRNPETQSHYYIFSDNFFEMLKEDKIKVIGKSLIDCCNGNQMVFKDSYGNIETIDDVDDIINCVGYDVDFSFFSEDIKKIISFDLSSPHLPIILYNHTLSPKLDNMAFVGIYRTPSLLEMEMQARYAIYGFAGIIKLPTKETMFEGIKSVEKIRDLNEDIIRPQFALESNLIFCDQLAKEIGVLPDLNELKENDPLLYNINWDYLFHPSYYRIIGPYSDPEARNNLIEDYNHYFKILKKQ
ncbi:hypothetical protein RB653_009036 [Dictyostelium firmibasis]|uniref:Flavin-containing monooxygenase n=1 Tax=Dictyostelium firmibasis TaxID=79012 RepID=A0AAN7TTG2_9MYCE